MFSEIFFRRALVFSPVFDFWSAICFGMAELNPFICGVRYLHMPVFPAQARIKSPVCDHVLIVG